MQFSGGVGPPRSISVDPKPGLDLGNMRLYSIIYEGNRPIFLSIALDDKLYTL